MSHQQLYTLDEIGQVKPVTWAEYDQWEQTLDPSDRCPLGKKLKVDVLGSTTVTSLFCLVPMGFYGHKPQLFVTLAVGEGVWLTSVYTSHRACISGHRDILEKVRRASEFLPKGKKLMLPMGNNPVQQTSDTNDRTHHQAEA